MPLEVVVSNYELADIDTMNRLVGFAKAVRISLLKTMGPSAVAYVAAGIAFAAGDHYILMICPLMLLIGLVQRAYRVARFVSSPISMDEQSRIFLFANENARFRFTPDGICVSARNGTSNMKPAHFKRAVHSAEGLALCTRSGNYVIPIRAFESPEQMHRAVEILKAMGVAVETPTV
ncbi:MAG TPA: hypothetical protein VGB55_06340 [Tepidisphaeraceae bacterium]|jgi:hypothetical protein